MALTLQSAPANEPLTTADAKKQLVVEHSLDDTYIDALVVAVRMQIETYLRRALITQTWKWTLDEFPSYEIELPNPNLQSITSIQYVDGNGATQTLTEGTDFIVDTESSPGRISPAYGLTWPTTRDVMGAVTIIFVAGYGDNASDIPDDIVHAVRLMLSHYYENREATTALNLKEIPYGYRSLLWPHRYLRF